MLTYHCVDVVTLWYVQGDFWKKILVREWRGKLQQC